MTFQTHLEQIGKRLVPLAVLGAVTAGVFAAAQDKIPHFWEIPDYTPATETAQTTATSATQSRKPTDTSTAAETQDEPQEYIPAGATDLRYAMNEGDVLALAGGVYEPFTLTEATAAGYSLSDDTYTADSSLLVSAGGYSFIPQERSLYQHYEKKVRYERPDTISAPVAVYDEYLTEALTVKMYMGLILVCYSNGEEIYSSDGTYIYTSLEGDPKPAYTRDKKGNPLFSLEEEELVEKENEDGKKVKEKVKVTKFYTVSENGFAAADYDDTTDNRGLYFDYPASWGLSDNSMIRLVRDVTTVTEMLDGTEQEETSLRYAFGYSSWGSRTSYRFYDAWDFSEGFAGVTDENGHFYFINTSCYKAFATESTFYYYERFMAGYLLPPVSNGIESLGFFYYDHGLVRVRRQYIDWYGKTYLEKDRVSLDEDYLMDTTGEEFELPDGCDIVAYSDGIILLECEGKYGYMDYTGAWIAQPIYDRAEPFLEGLGVCGFADGVTLVLDTAGNAVVPAGNYEYISAPSSGILACYSANGGWTFLWKVGNFGG